MDEEMFKFMNIIKWKYIVYVTKAYYPMKHILNM